MLGYQYLIKFDMKYDTNQFSGMDPILRRVTIRVRNPENDRYEVLDLITWYEN